MTRVDFYVMDDPNPRQHGELVCRLAEKAWRAGHAVYVRCEDNDTVEHLDALMWTYKDTAFVPHARVDDRAAEATPITLGHGDAVPPTHDVLVNLAGDVPAFFSRFERVMETSGVDAASRQAARDRYRYYQERGYALNTHKLGEKRG